MTHRIFRKTVILLITLSILLSTTACHLKEKTAEKATKDVVEQILEYKTAELTKYLDKNDPYYERQKALLDDLLPKMKALDVSENTKGMKPKNIMSVGQYSTTAYTYRIEAARSFEITVSVTKTDDDYFFTDNSDFLFELLHFYVDFNLYTRGETYFDELMEVLNISDRNAIAATMFDIFLSSSEDEKAKILQHLS